MPRTVANTVVKLAVTTLLNTAETQRSDAKKSRYHRSEYSWIGKVKNGSFEKDSGATTSSGATRNSITKTTETSNITRAARSGNVA